MSGGDFARFRRELAALSASLNANLIAFQRIESSQLTARRMLEELPDSSYPPERTMVVAWEQTAGRGRAGRGWVSPPGAGLYCTLVEPLPGPEPPQALPLSVAVALCRGLRDARVDRCEIKWPNDLMVEQRKLGGQLIETVSGPAGALPIALIGFGINLHASESAIGVADTTSVGEVAGRPIEPARMLEILAPRLRDLSLEPVPGPDLVAAYRSLLRHRPGDSLSWRQGAEAIQGSFVDIDDSGRILLETSEGRRLLSVGDIIEG